MNGIYVTTQSIEPEQEEQQTALPPSAEPTALPPSAEPTALPPSAQPTVQDQNASAEFEDKDDLIGKVKKSYGTGGYLINKKIIKESQTM